MKRFRIAALLVLLLALACGSPQGAEAADPSARATVPVITKKPVDTVVIDVPTATPAPTLPPTPTPTPEPTPTPTPPPLTGIKIGLDPGHQQRANINEEPIAPDETQTKMKCSSGTRGIATGIYEYEVNLNVALKLKALLEEAGAEVFITRETNNVNLSNRERAEFFNENEVDLAVRLHCNGTDDTSVRGAFMLLPTQERTMFYNENVRAATVIIEQYCRETGLSVQKRNGITYSSTQTGFNWCTRPIVCIEMGHLTNESEDLLLTSDTFQDKMAVGILNGILAYFGPDA
ncbi:MAG: N-acetylmuramoyl-L-alanine amidase [Clostridia bacterium]|nr:N-acetylmuramoyl-L-alanine amidase [Clostridia bacterium]